MLNNETVSRKFGPRMKILIAIFLLLGVSTQVVAQGDGRGLDQDELSSSEGIFQSIKNADTVRSGKYLSIRRRNARLPIELVFTRCQGIGVHYDKNQWWVLPISAPGATVEANRALWILPLDPRSRDQSWHLELHGGDLSAQMTKTGLTLMLRGESATLSKAEARPHNDLFGHRFSLQFADGAELEDALAAFYWGTILPSVVEKTMAANFPYNSGYVLSTLNVKSYAGSYPAVDHEFQIKGRLAMGSEVDLDVVRRMIELQFKLMEDDPESLYRCPLRCSPTEDASTTYVGIVWMAGRMRPCSL